MNSCDESVHSASRCCEGGALRLRIQARRAEFRRSRRSPQFGEHASEFLMKMRVLEGKRGSQSAPSLWRCVDSDLGEGRGTGVERVRAATFRTSRRDFGACFSMPPEPRDHFVEFSDAA
jgi:hypothetical protein